MSQFFSQGIAILCSETPDLIKLKQVLENNSWPVLAYEETSDWPEMQGPRITLQLPAGSNTICWLDTCAATWPDELGADGESKMVAAAHAMGAYGPFAKSGALMRAVQNRSRAAISEAVTRHRAFVRLRTTPFFTVDAPQRARASATNEDSDPVGELTSLLHLAACICTLPECLIYFNPNAELLMLPVELSSTLQQAEPGGDFPVAAVVSTRLYEIDATILQADTVGMAQLDLRDHEFAFPNEALPPAETSSLLLGMAMYQIDTGAQIASGHTTSGPQSSLWRAKLKESSQVAPERAVVHWTLATESTKSPAEAGDESQGGRSDEALCRIAASIDKWVTQQQAMRARAVHWLHSSDFHASFYNDAHPPPSLQALLHKKVGKKEGADAWKNAETHGIQSPQLWAEYQQLITHGHIWFATPIMVNPEFSQRPDESLPCLVLAAAEQTAGNVAFGGIFSSYLFNLYRGGKERARHPKLARIMDDDEFQLFRRVPLPEEETEGFACTALNIHLRKDWMPPEDVPFIPLLVQPGSKGAMVQIPWSVAVGTPPLPGSMKPGKWAELSPSRHRTQAPPLKHPTAQSWFGRFLDLLGKTCLLLFLIGLAAGLLSHFGGEEGQTSRPTVGSSPKKLPPKVRQVITIKNWMQSPEIMTKVSTTRHENYDPLTGEGMAGSAFLFRTEQRLVLAGSSRHQFDDPAQPPRKLLGLDDLIVTLNHTELIRASDSQIQLVSNLSEPAGVLEYRRSDILRDGDQVRLVLGKGRWVEAVLDLAGDFTLSSGPVLLQAQAIATTENVAGSSGSPVVHVQTGRVVGVMLGADQADSPSMIEFETIAMPLLIEEKPPGP